MPAEVGDFMAVRPMVRLTTHRTGSVTKRGAVPAYREAGFTVRLLEGFDQMLKIFVQMQNFLADPVRRDDRGATAVEYGLLVALIAAVIVTVVAALGTKLSSMFNTVTNSI